MITEERTKDDGVERQTMFVLEGAPESGRKLPSIEVRAAQFAGMSWVSSEWGARTVVNAGVGAKDHLRAGIQLLSGDIPSRTTYTHMGWREIDGAHYYFRAGGAIGAPGEALPETLHVELEPKLARYCFPEPPQGERLVRALRASLSYLDLAPCPLTVPILGAVFRAPLGAATFSLHLSGLTGAGKSVLSVLAQQHYGAGLDEKHIPASWSSTDNALEGSAFAAKDALLLVDDYKLEGSLADQQRLDARAARIFRAQGNLTGRGRMKADGTLRPDRPPRGLILSTGEDVPSGHSIRARNVFLNITPTDTDWQRVTAAQRDASDGLYAKALAAFIAWLAEDYPARKELFTELYMYHRNTLQGRAAHKRTADAGGQLLATWHLVLDFALESSVLTKEERTQYWQLVETALLTTLNAQHAAQESADPVTHFRELLTDALASQRCHVAATDGGYPGAGMGWLTIRDQGKEGETFEKHTPKGDRIGWTDGDYYYLLPGATFAVLQDLARRQNTSLGVTQQTLWKRLDEAGLIAVRDGRHLTIKRNFEGDDRVRVLCVPCTTIRKSGASGATGLGTPSQTQVDATHFRGFSGDKQRDKRSKTLSQTITDPRAPHAPLLENTGKDSAPRDVLTWEEL